MPPSREHLSRCKRRTYKAVIDAGRLDIPMRLQINEAYDFFSSNLGNGQWSNLLAWAQTAGFAP